MKKKASAGTLKRLLAYVKKYIFLLIVSLALTAVSVALTLYVPMLTGDAIDFIIGEGNVDFGAVLAVILKIVAAVAVTAVARWLMSLCNNRMTYLVVRDIRRDAFSKLQTLPLRYIDSHPTGDTVSRIITDADQLGDGLLLGFTQFFGGVITILGTLVIMLCIDFRVASVVVVITPVSMLIASFIAKRTYNMFKLQSEIRGEQTAFIEECIANQKVVQAFGHEDESICDFDEINSRLEKASLKAMFYSATVNPTTRFVNSMVYAGVALLGAFMAIASPGFTVGRLVSMLSYSTQYTKPFNEISEVVTELQNALACASRIFEITDEEPQIPDPEGACVLDDTEGNVSIADVSFSYNKNVPLITDFSVDVKKGEMVAIVGPTGCGKTTLINLLMRFYEVDGGSISVDGNDIRSITRNSLRRSYGMVLQDTWLRGGTVRENIAMGRPSATIEEIKEAARMAHAHSFIKRLPDGYNTVISEGGANLSQGQRQLLCIARVMLCMPPMLILDEATSSIDTRTEMKIQSAFSKMMEGRTSFIVAHRLSTIKEADLILVMKDGSVVEKGTHEELLRRGGFYSELYNAQFVETE